MLASQDMPADTPQLSAYLLQVFEAGKGAEDHSGGIRTGLDSRAFDTSYIYIYIDHGVDLPKNQSSISR